MTAPPAGALEACLALLEKATPGEWEVVQGDEWTTDIGTPEGEYDDGRKRHWNVASVNRRRDEWDANRHMIAGAVNLLKDHGPALLAALRLREGWVPVSERLPPDGELVEVYAPDSGNGELLDFDGVHDGLWIEHECRREHFLVVGGAAAAGPDCVCTGPNEAAPYTHWRRIVRPTADDLARVLEESATGDEAASA